MNLEDFREVFLEELTEQLEEMERQILNPESHGASDEAVQSLFRAAHTLKGSAAAMGLEDMKNLTHELEQLLDEVRKGQLGVTKGLIGLLFEGYDALRVLQESYAISREHGISLGPLIGSIQSVVRGESPSLDDKVHAEAFFTDEFPDSVRYLVKQAIEEGFMVYV